ncbi:MAG: phosphate ABC transporter permease PstA [Planctomycetales bacterium]
MSNLFRRPNKKSLWLNWGFEYLCLAATLVGMAMVVTLFWLLIHAGWKWVDWQFLTSFPSRMPERAGVKAALAGSLWLIGLTVLICVPVGVGSAVYLEEYAPRRSWWRRAVETNIANLAGVPSIVYGILGLGLFVRWFALGRSLLAGALTLALVILPVVILASQEALRAVPDAVRHASHALGATRWQTIWRQVLPAAAPSIITGVILAVSRALGEAAPLVTIGALTYIAFVPESVMDPFTALPIQVFNWTSRPQEDFHSLAAAGILVLLALLLGLNGLAAYVRFRFSKNQVS